MLPTGRGRVWIHVLQHILLRGGSFGFNPPHTHTPCRALFPAIKMFPDLRYIWKVLENPTGRRLGQKSSFSHAIQEAQHKMLALQDSPAPEPYTQGWRTMADRGALWETAQWRTLRVLY